MFEVLQPRGLSWVVNQPRVWLPAGEGSREGCPQPVLCVCVCVCVKCFSVLCSSTAVISAHPIHSLDPPHHHFHSGSLASPTRSFLHHQLSPWPLGSAMSHSDRADSTGERPTLRDVVLCATVRETPANWSLQLGQSPLWGSMRDGLGTDRILGGLRFPG